MEDSLIVDMYLQRDENAIVETDKKYRGYGLSLSMNILHNHEDSEECLNDTYIAMWNHIPPDIPHHLKCYLGKIIKNISLDMYRRKKRKQKYEIETLFEELESCIPSSFDVDYEIEKKELTLLIDKFLKQQKPFHRNLFILRYWYGETISSIAIKCHLSENQVKVYLFRIRQQFKNYLERQGMKA